MAEAMQAAAYLFVAQGAFYLFIGLATIPGIRLTRIPSILFFSRRSDTLYFGKDSVELLGDPAVRGLRDLLFMAVAGLLSALGVSVMALAWFGVRAGAAWAFWSLAVAGLLAAVYWAVILARYLRAGAKVGLGDAPPFMWVTAALWAAATALGAWDLA